MRKISFALLFLVLTNCSGIKVLDPKRNIAEKVDTSKLYDQSFLQKINSVQDKHRKGKTDLALKELMAIKEEGLKPTEKASRKNLIGVMNFSKKNYELASKEFDGALLMAKEDPYLEAQINLNLGSVFFKMGQNEKAHQVLSLVNYKNLQDGEAKKFHQLYALLSQQLGKKEESLSSTIRALDDKKTIREVSSEPRFAHVEELFQKLSNSEKIRLLEEFDQDNNVTIAYLAYKEAENAFRAGDQDKVKDFAEWIEKRYVDNPEVMNLLSGLVARNKNNSAKIDLRYLGIILPLSGEQKGLGERALAGIDIALENLTLDPTKKYRLEIKDSKGNPASGAFAVKDLIEVNNVSAIIGGLNSAEATKEYLEAKKYGVIFISLSKVLLPKEEKNHLLIEIPGSIESQVNHLFSNKMLSKLGSRPAILYPKTEIGESYANEFWRQSKKNNLGVTGLISFDINQTDYRDPVKNILGIKFDREREEELSIVNDIASLESKRSIKRLQNLQPQIDFDWIFVPALPREVVQILPNFNYFDAFNLNYVGVPSWRSELMMNEGYRYGNVYFMDEFSGNQETSFSQAFYNKFNKLPNVVETIAYDSFKVLFDLIETNSNFESRQDLDVALTKKETLKGENGLWKLQDDIWMKDMSTFKIKREGIEEALL